jgi:hypothetical protein
MARYATTDPILSSVTADTRKGLSLIAPLAAKKRRTVKKVLVEVKFSSFLITRLLFTDKSHFVRFQTRIQQPSASEPTNALPTGMTFITFLQRSTLAFTLNLILAEETMVDHPVDIPVPQHISPPRAETPAQVEISSSSGTQSPSAQTETPTPPEMNFHIQPEPSSPSRVQSPIGQAETPTLTEAAPSPLQLEASELLETAPAPSYIEASALPRAPPSLVAPEIAPETEQNLVPVQEVRHEVNICT